MFVDTVISSGSMPRKAFVILCSAFSFRPAISPPILRPWGESVSEAGKIDNGTTAR